MCLVFVGWRAHPRYRLVVAANRDEYHARPTAPAAPWAEERGAADGRRTAADGEAVGARGVPPAIGTAASTARSGLEDAADLGSAKRRILAGRDLEAGGTWLGATAEGRFAALTNFRGALPPGPGAPSRGRLAVDYLRSDLGARAHARYVAREAGRFSGFNLLLGDRDELFCVTNRGEERITEVPAGCHGLSNDRLNVPWSKVTGGLARFRRLLGTEFETDDLFALLADDEPASEADLRGTGLERAHSARFIRGEAYGTRSSTVVCIDWMGAAAFEERSFDARASETGRVAFESPAAGGDGFSSLRTPLPARTAAVAVAD